MADKIEPNEKQAPPKSGKKGGARYPRHALGTVLPWAKKLVLKTHLGPQSKDVILAGVVEATSSRGEIKISALKQYDLLDGDSRAYNATDLAKKIYAAPDDELTSLYQRAALSPDIFKALFQTFHGDDVSKAKLRQRASDLNVHPEETAKCIDVYASTLEIAGLATLEGDKVVHIKDTQLNGVVTDKIEMEAGDRSNGDDEITTEGTGIPEISTYPRSPQPAIIHVNVTLDSSLDTDKLEKQLSLLRKYGAI